MATKTFCDGCGSELTQPWQIKKLTFQMTEHPADKTMDSGAFDLCSDCAHRFRFHHLPRSWPHAIEAKPEADSKP
jgi:hypothetical protein